MIVFTLHEMAREGSDRKNSSIDPKGQVEKTDLQDLF